MKSRGWMRVAGTAAAIMVAALGPGGCNEDDGGSNELDGYFESHPFVTDPRADGSSSGVVSVSPTAAQVNQVGGKALFKASGGDGSYTWDVANTSVGTISANGAQAVYTALAIGNNNVIVFDGGGNAALAAITGTGPAALTASASPGTLEGANALAVLTASGGVPPYTWTLTDGVRGSLPDGNTGSTVVYLRKTAGDNAATVTDGAGNSASVIISQP